MTSRTPAGGAHVARAGAAGLDAAPQAPLRPAARAALTEALDRGWADPARLHAEGRAARTLLDEARATIGRCLGARADEVFFASSGAAAAQEALLGAATAHRRRGTTAVVSAVEHAAVLHAARWLGEAVELAVDDTGAVDAAAFLAACAAPGVAVASLQWGNGEVGTLQPVQSVALALRDGGGPPLHVDASAVAGRLPVDATALGCAHLTADAGGWGGPPGVGIRVTRTGARWRRPGPEVGASLPVPLIVAAAAGLEEAEREREALAARHRTMIQRLRQDLVSLVPDLLVAGPADDTRRLPHLLTVSALYVDGEALVTGLDRRGVAAASGSACTADTVEPSHVLAAMGFLTQGNLRIALGRDTTDDHIEALLHALPAVVAEIRAAAGVAGL